MENQLPPAMDGETDVGAFAGELSALMDRHGISEYANYAQTPTGLIMSYSSDQAIQLAHDAFGQKVYHQILTNQSVIPLQS